MIELEVDIDISKLPRASETEILLGFTMPGIDPEILPQILRPGTMSRLINNTLQHDKAIGLHISSLDRVGLVAIPAVKPFVDAIVMYLGENPPESRGVIDADGSESIAEFCELLEARGAHRMYAPAIVSVIVVGDAARKVINGMFNGNPAGSFYVETL